MPHRIEETVARGICIGLRRLFGSHRRVRAHPMGMPRMYQANIDGVDPGQLRPASRVCPFSDEAMNEDDLVSCQVVS